MRPIKSQNDIVLKAKKMLLWSPSIKCIRLISSAPIYEPCQPLSPILKLSLNHFSTFIFKSSCHCMPSHVSSHVLSSCSCNFVCTTTCVPSLCSHSRAVLFMLLHVIICPILFAPLFVIGLFMTKLYSRCQVCFNLFQLSSSAVESEIRICNETIVIAFFMTRVVYG